MEIMGAGDLDEVVDTDDSDDSAPLCSPPNGIQCEEPSTATRD